MVKVMRAVLVAVLALAAIAAAAPDAKAAPPAVPWSGQAAGDAALVDLNLPGNPALAGVRLANAQSTASSTSTPRVSSVTRNVASAVPGLGIAPQGNDQTAPPENAAAETPGSRVILFVDGRPVGSVMADAGGNWRLTLDGKLPDGEHEISAIAVDPAGNESAVRAITLTVDTSGGSGPGSGPVLASTGGPQVAVAIVAALLLTGGGVLLAGRRRILGR